MSTWKSVVIGFGAGLLGVLVALLLWTAYIDHQRVAIMWGVMTTPRPAATTPPPVPEK